MRDDGLLHWQSLRHCIPPVERGPVILCMDKNEGWQQQMLNKEQHQAPLGWASVLLWKLPPLSGKGRHAGQFYVVE